MTDQYGCSDDTTVTVAEPDVLVANSTGMDSVSCNGLFDGSASVTAIGGNGTYSYLWDANAGSQTSDTAIGLGAGTYTVTVTDQYGCSDDTTVTVAEPLIMIVDTTYQDSVTCNGLTDGSATVVVSGGNGTYSYLWDVNAGSQTSDTAIGLGAGNYAVTVTDQYGCFIDTSVSVFQKDSLIIGLISQDSVSCFGASDGLASVSNITGAGGIYFYQWDASAGSQTSDTASNLASGVYTVTVSDQNGCNLDTSIIVLEPNPINIGFISQDSISCNGLNDGLAFINIDSISGGNGTYSYLWDVNAGSQITDTAFNLVAGIYSITVSDQMGCFKDTSVEVLQPNPILLSSRVDSSTCGNNDGGAYVDASGGAVTVDYFYSWQNNSGLDLNNNNDSLIGVPTGNYLVSVTDDNSCTDSLLILVPEIGGPQVNDSVLDILCFGDTTGSIHISAIGLAPFSYTWFGPTGLTIPGDTSIISNLDTGLYAVIVTDSNNCSTTLDSIRISEPNSPLTIDTTVKSLTCNNDLSGEITINVNNGTAPFNYSWTGENGFNATTQNISSLAAGIYILNVIDSNSCKIINDSISVDQPDSIIISETLFSPTCNNSDGSIVVNVSGGSVNNDYSYSWDNLTLGALGIGADDTLANIGPGSYQINIQDDSLCTASSIISINNENGPVVQDSIVNITCSGDSDGAIYLTISNLSGIAYGVDWDNDGLIGSGDIDGPDSDSVLNLSAGLYTVYVTDSTNGCVTILDTNVLDPGIIVLAPSTDSVSCNGNLDGSVSVLATGGNLGYTYLWDVNAGSQASDTAFNLGVGTYSVTVTDQKGCTSDTLVTLEEPNVMLISSTWTDSVSCNGLSDGRGNIQVSGGNGINSYLWDFFAGAQTSDTAINLSIGTYSVTVTDQKGCNVDTTVTIYQPNLISIDTIFQDSVSCFGLSDGYAAVGNIIGGNGIFTYLWDVSAGSQTTDTAFNLPSGSYFITVSDQKGCSKDTIVNVVQPDSLLIEILSQDSVSCFGLSDGKAIVDSISGGNGIYSFLWDLAAGSQTTDTAFNLISGLYTITVFDQNGCFDDSTINVEQPDSLIIFSTSQDSVSCYGLGDGKAIVDSISGGNGIFAYTWDASAGIQTNDDTATNLIAGAYWVTVSDQNNCIDSVSITVLEPNSIIVYTSSDSVSCYGLSDGIATVDSVSGGNGIFTYLWDASAGSQTTDTAFNLISGLYTITVFDQNGCFNDTTINVGQPDSLIVDTLSTTNPYCASVNDGSINLDISGGTFPLITSWTNQANTFVSTDQNIDSLFLGTYIVTVTDNNGCIAIDSITLSPIVEIIVNAGLDTLVCLGDSLIITGSSTGTNTPTLEWAYYNPLTATDSTISSGSVSADVSGFTQDSANVINFIYTVEEQSCIVKDSILVNVASLPVVDAGFDTILSYNDPYILGGNPTGPAGATFIWSPLTNFLFQTDSIEPNPSVEVLSSEVYTVFVTDTNGCKNFDQVEVQLEPDIVVPSGFSPNGDGKNDTWIIQNLDQFVNTKVSVYNRWGSLLFVTEDVNQHWNGGGNNNEMIPVGTYYYIIEFDGYDGMPQNITGPITIIR